MAVTTIKLSDFAEKEATINKKLKRINKNYGISNLYQTKTGKYKFKLTMFFRPEDLDRVKKVFETELKGTDPEEQIVDVKLRLTGRERKKLKRIAAETGWTQSALVAKCIDNIEKLVF